MVKPVIVEDVDIANVMYTSPAVGEEEAPTFEESGISIEPHVGPEGVEICDVRSINATTVQEERGGFLDDVAWPSQELEHYPLTLIMKNIRDPLTQPGSPGGISPRTGTIGSLVSASSEQPIVYSL